MIFIGEKLNSSIKAVFEAVEKADAVWIQQMAAAQEDAGADYIDVNAGMFNEDEAEKLLWMIDTVRAVTSLPLCIDTPSPEVAAKAMQRYQGPKPLLNSITLEKDRFEPMLETALKYKTGLIALCMDDNGMPETVEARVDIAKRLAQKLTAAGIAAKDIFVDPMLSPVSTGDTAGADALSAIRQIRNALPECHITCGLSNVSYGLPARAYINRAFLLTAMTAGLDSAIVNPLDKELMSLYYAANTVLGNDEYCCEYIQQYRDGMFDR